jgi:hypothetical protein
VIVTGEEHLQALVAGRMHDAKMVFNERGAIVFPISRQHCEMKVEGISYEDNYAGNALAAMLRRDAIEIRFHQAFDDKSVTRIITALLGSPSFSCLTHPCVTYQGRTIVR